MKNLKIKSETQAIGTITVREHTKGTIDWLKILLAHDMRDEALKIMRAGRVATVQSNLIMQGTNTGKALLVNRLIGDTTYTAIVNYGAIGTGSTTPAVSDTQLTTESARTTLAFGQNVSNNQAVLQFFFTDATLANTTYREFGTFVDGTASANTGKILNHALFSVAYTKSAGTDVTVEVDITFT